MSNSTATPWTVAYQAPLSMGFSRQEYWSGLPFSSPGDLPDPRIEPISPGLVGGFFTTEPSGKSQRDREKSQIQKASKALVYLVNHQVDSLDLFLSWASLVAQMVKKKKKNPPAMRETQEQSLGREDPLEKRMATYSSILAWRIPQTKESGGLQSMGS